MTVNLDNEITRIWDGTGNSQRARIRYENNSLFVELESGEQLRDIGGVLYQECFEILVGSEQKKLKMNNPIRVHLPPLIMKQLPYTASEQANENIFPESSHGWYGRMLYGKNDAVYILQEIQDENRLWLSILNPENGVIFEKHMIHKYEGGVLALHTSADIREQWKSYLAPENSDEVIQSVMGILEEPALSWSELNQLTQGVECPPLFRGEMIRDSLDTLVPITFPIEIRNQIMAFLAWIAKDTRPNIDPVEYFHKILPLPFFKSLLAVHYHFLAKGKSIPQYVKLLNLSSTSRYKSSRLLDETLEQKPHNRFHYRILEMAPDYLVEVIRYAKTLVQTSTVQTVLPISKMQALKSRNAWNSKLWMMIHGLYLRANVRPSSLGLATLVYVGAAYRWAHNKLFWSTRLGAIADRPSHLQMMIMPFASAERVRRLIPKIVDIVWSARTSNLELFDEISEKWTISDRKILTSINKSCSLSKLRKDFGCWGGREARHLTRTEALIVDKAGSLLYLADLENDRALKKLGVTNKEIKDVLEHLRDNGIIDITYGVIETKLISVLTIIQGKPNNVCSLTKALLKYTPTSLALVGKEGLHSFVISRIPSDKSDIVLKELPRIAQSSDLYVRCFMPEAFRSYTGDFYQRLLKPDGTWDDDVSGLLSQVRSAPKHLKDEVL